MIPPPKKDQMFWERATENTYNNKVYKFRIKCVFRMKHFQLQLGAIDCNQHSLIHFRYILFFIYVAKYCSYRTQHVSPWFGLPTLPSLCDAHLLSSSSQGHLPPRGTGSWRERRAVWAGGGRERCLRWRWTSVPAFEGVPRPAFLCFRVGFKKKRIMSNCVLFVTLSER